VQETLDTGGLVAIRTVVHILGAVEPQGRNLGLAPTYQVTDEVQKTQRARFQ